MPLVEKRYAEALVKISAEKNMIGQHQQELGLAADIYANNEDFRNFLLNPRSGKDKKKDFLHNAFSGRVQDEILNLLMLLLDKGRIKYLKGIYDEYVKLADEKQNVLSLTIMTPAPLEAEQVYGISEKFRKLYHAASVKAEVIQDNSLIGGVKVRIGDKLVDGSIKGRLKDLQGILLK